MKFLFNILSLLGLLILVAGVPVPHRRHFHGHGHGRFGGGYGGGYGGYPGYGGGYGGYPGYGGGFGGGQSASYANAQSVSASFGPFSFSASNANSAANSFGFGR